MTCKKHNTWVACMALGLAFAAATPALAQDTTSTRQSNSSGPAGRLEEYHGAFRASELVGATVYNTQGNSIGTVNDVLLDTSGKADKVVISVGGFLGIDSKYVDIGFDQLKIEPSHNGSSEMTTNTAANTTTSTNNTKMNTATGMNTTTGAPHNSTMAANNTTGSMDSSKYYSIVMPGATKQSLEKMPEFKYSS